MVYDIIIVGGSVVGLFLAKEFAEKGRSVLVLEKNKKIGQKVCSGLVSSHIFDYFSKKDISKFIERKIEGAKLWVEREPFAFKGDALVINREKFDRYLFDEAINRGVKILPGKEVIDFEEKKYSVKTFLKSGECFESKTLAGCDGVYSTVAKKTGFLNQKKTIFGVICFEKNIPSDKDKIVDLFFSKKFHGFFAWRIPRENLIEWGMALDPKEKPLEKLKEFLKERDISFSVPKGAFIPYFPLRKTAKGRIFLCGDSAGQIKPYTGGGLIYGFECAKIAAKVINNFKNPNFQKYEKEWRKSLMKEIYFGNFLRKCYFLPNFIKKTGLSFLKNRRNIDQDKPSSIF